MSRLEKALIHKSVDGSSRPLSFGDNSGMDIDQRIRKLNTELIDIYRNFHTYPELGFQEFKTQERIYTYLASLGLKPERIANTGVLVTMTGKRPGRVILLRSDMDALPITEETGLPHASRNEGLMHACGHDGHMAMLLVAAKILNDIRGHFSGTVKILFQPNEEDAGAWKVIAAGVMDSPPVDVVFGIHLWSQCPTGCIDIVDGTQMAASYYFNLIVKGHGGHAGFVHESVDPIYIAALIIQAVQGIQTREVNALHPAAVIFTRIDAGSNMTIVPSQAQLEGSIRFLYSGGEELLERFEKVVASICSAYRAEYELNFKRGNGLLFNNPAAAALAREAAIETVGVDKVSAQLRTMAGEDFADYLDLAPGAFAFVGISNPTKMVTFPHHHPRFTIDEEALAIGTELHVRTALKLLEI